MNNRWTNVGECGSLMQTGRNDWLAIPQGVGMNLLRGFSTEREAREWAMLTPREARATGAV